MHIRIICDDIFRTKIVIYSVFILQKSFLLLLFCQIFVTLTRIFFCGLFLAKNSCWFFYRIMSAISSQRRVRQRTEEE
jgi:hypothetical protein